MKSYRHKVLVGGALLFSVFLNLEASAQAIHDFTSVEPLAQDQLFHLPETHSFQYLLNDGDAPGGNPLKKNFDYTGYLRTSLDGLDGKLFLNHETRPGAISIFDLTFATSNRKWSLSNYHNVDFSTLGGSARDCAGGFTPWGTYIAAEEFIDSVDANQDGYLDQGWLVEIDAVSGEIIDHDGDQQPDKLWAMGRMNHENVALLGDQRTAYLTADEQHSGFVYKYVADQAGDLSQGDLFVLKKDSLMATEGTWIQLQNTTVADCNSTITQALNVGATNFGYLEEVEIGPDGLIYFASKQSGRIYRFLDLGATVSNAEVHVESQDYTINYGNASAQEPWGVGQDNLAFDGDGNLWVLQDGTRDHIWVVGADHTPANPSIKLFARTPAGCEPTGITFSHDYNYIFMSIQHPSTANVDFQTDAFGQDVVWDRSTAIVIARKERLNNQVDGVEESEKETLKLSIQTISIGNRNLQITGPIGTYEVTVFNLNGAEVRRNQVRVSAASASLQVADLAAGAYIVRVTGESQSKQLKFFTD